jgi:hypothetical protein
MGTGRHQHPYRSPARHLAASFADPAVAKGTFFTWASGATVNICVAIVDHLVRTDYRFYDCEAHEYIGKRGGAIMIIELWSSDRSLSMSARSVLAAILAIACTAALAQPAGKPIVIGVPQTLSGPFSNFGKDDQIAFKMALEDVNKAGGINGRPLHFDFVDDQAKTDLTRSVVQKMIDVDKDIMILGGDTSATCTVVAQQVQQAKVPYLMHVCLADNLTMQGWNYVFRIPPPINLATHRYSITMARLRSMALSSAAARFDP